MFHLSKDGKYQALKLHILVCTAFHGPRPFNTVCCHRDDDKLNNVASNLYWGSIAQNAKDAIKNRRLKVGSDHHRSKITEQDVLAMRKLREETGMTYTAIGQKYGVGKRTARLAIQGHSWRHVPCVPAAETVTPVAYTPR